MGFDDMGVKKLPFVRWYSNKTMFRNHFVV